MTRESQRRKNNPPVGLVDSASDAPVPREKTYAYDLHLDPQLASGAGLGSAVPVLGLTPQAHLLLATGLTALVLILFAVPLAIALKQSASDRVVRELDASPHVRAVYALSGVATAWLASSV